MPPNTIYVGRPTKWGNPFAIADFEGTIDPREMAVSYFKKWLYESPQESFRDEVRRELAGKDLACWCRPGDSCHADILLELANLERD